MEMQTENIEVKKQIWKNHISGEEYSDAQDILYYKNHLNDEKYSNLLLGNFNSDGNYSIEKELMQELINVNKFITDNVEGVYYLSSKTKTAEFDLKFLLKIKNDDENNKKIASLVLIEPFTSLDNEFSTDFHTVVARYRDENDIYFMPKVAKVFHIFDKRDENGKEEENEEILLNILKLKNQLKLMKNKLGESNEYLSQYYIDNVLAILKKYPGKYSDYILRKYAMLLEANKGNINKKNYYKMLRLELDKLLMSSKHMCDNPDLLKALAEQKQIFVVNYEKFEDNIKIPAEAAAKKVEAPSKSSSKASSPAKNSAAKKKAAGGKKVSPAKKNAAPQFKWLIERKDPTLPKDYLANIPRFDIPHQQNNDTPQQQKQQEIIVPENIRRDITSSLVINVNTEIQNEFTIPAENKNEINENLSLTEESIQPVKNELTL